MIFQENFKKDLTRQMMIFGPIFLILLFLCFFLFYKVKNTVQEVLTLKNQASMNQQMFTNFSALKFEKKQSADIFEAILKIMPDREQILAIVSNLEKKAAGSGLKQSFTFGQEHQDVNGINDIGFSLTLNGDLENFLAYLKSVESAVQFIQFSSVEVTRVEPGYQINTGGRIYKK